MFDLGWSELLVIGIVALIILGPRDLTKLFRELGRFTGKARRMARDFQRAMEDAADETGMKDAAKDLRNMTKPSKMGMDKIKDAANSFEDYDPTKPPIKPSSKPATKAAAKTDKAGPATAEMTEERAEAAARIREYSAQKGQERLDREKAEAAAPTEAPDPAPDGGESKA